MLTRSKCQLRALTAAAVATGLVAAPARADTPACGDKIAESITLEADLYCYGDALKVVAPDVTVDLGGHRIVHLGSPADAGIRTDQDSVTIRNGAIYDFDTDVLVEHADAANVESLELRAGGGDGINTPLSVTGADARIANVKINGPMARGAAIDGPAPKLVNVTVERAPDPSVPAGSAVGLVVVGDGAQVAGATIKGDIGHGLSLAGDEAVVAWNTIAVVGDDTSGIYAMGIKSRVAYNKVTAWGDSAVGITAIVDGGEVDHNTVGSTGLAIKVPSKFTTLTANTTFASAFGIDADPDDTIDGGGNTFDGGPAGCIGVVCAK